MKTRKATDRSGRNAASLPRSVPDVKGEGPSGPEMGGRDNALAAIALAIRSSTCRPATMRRALPSPDRRAVE